MSLASSTRRPGKLGSRAAHHLDLAYQSHLRTLRLGFGAILLVFAIGTAAYMVVEGWTFLDSFYMVVITLSTVGFSEVNPLTEAGRTVTIGLVIAGVGTFAFVAAVFSRILVEGELQGALGRRRMDKEIKDLRDHVIVCGFGRVGKQICSNLRADEVPVLVIDHDEAALDAAAALGIPYVEGNAVEEEVLEAAGLDRARSLLLTLSNEADNVYVTLLAKERRRDLQIIARSITDQGDRRLLAAGASRVVSPERIGALSMSNTVIRPNAVQFTELMTARENLDLELDEVALTERSSLIGNSIAECNIRQNFGLIVVGIITPSGEMVFNPEPNYRLEAGSKLIIIGRRDELRRFGGAA